MKKKIAIFSLFLMGAFMVSSNASVTVPPQQGDPGAACRANCYALYYFYCPANCNGSSSCLTQCQAQFAACYQACPH